MLEKGTTWARSPRFVFLESVFLFLFEGVVNLRCIGNVEKDKVKRPTRFCANFREQRKFSRL